MSDDYATKDDLKTTAEWMTNRLIAEMAIRFSQVNQRLDRIDATLVNHGEQLAAGVRLLAELSELKMRVKKLEGKE